MRVINATIAFFDCPTVLCVLYAINYNDPVTDPLGVYV